MIKQWINKLTSFFKTKETKEGTVKFFNSSKGFGFIILKDSDTEIFVHSTNLIDKIREKDQVTFEIEKGDKGLIAVNVERKKK
jgi:CspA family cold shock protein